MYTRFVQTALLVSLFSILMGNGCSDIVSGADAGVYVPEQNIDECAEELDDCSQLAICTDLEENYACTCPEGYDGDGRIEGTGCNDIDECATGSAGCHEAAECENTDGGFECLCRYPTFGDGFSCENWPDTICDNLTYCLQTQTCNALDFMTCRRAIDEIHRDEAPDAITRLLEPLLNAECEPLIESLCADERMDCSCT